MVSPEDYLPRRALRECLEPFGRKLSRQGLWEYDVANRGVHYRDSEHCVHTFMWWRWVAGLDEREEIIRPGIEQVQILWQKEPCNYWSLVFIKSDKSVHVFLR